MDDEDETAGEDAALRSVPLADLFLALGASFLFALFLARPELGRVPAGPGDPVAALVAGAPTLENRAPLVLLARPGGVDLPGEPGATTTPLTALGPGAPLLGLLREANEDGRPVLVAVAPGGEEAAFLLDPLLAGTMRAPIHQVRLDAACRFLRQAPRPGADCLAALRGG